MLVVYYCVVDIRPTSYFLGVRCVWSLSFWGWNFWHWRQSGRDCS